MQTSLSPAAERPGSVQTGRNRAPRPLERLREAGEWLAGRALASRKNPTRREWKSVALCSALVFLIAVGVRVLSLHDNAAQIAQGGPWMSHIAAHYKSEANRMLGEGGVLYPNRTVDPGDARLILHPPGYSALIAGLFAFFGQSDSAIRIAQIIADALSAVLVLLIAGQFFHRAIATIAATLAALSPHLAYYSLAITPDTLPVLPILLAVYLLVLASKKPRLMTIVLAGAVLGVSCWLRANGLLLSLFLGAAIVLLFDGRKRLMYAAAFVCSTVLVVSPITIRNYLLFHHFVPVSIAGGENLVVGIADFDKEGRFDMPASDGEAATKDAEWYQRADYATSAWFPDGVERDQARFSRGFAVVRANPGWFLKIMFQRALFMLRYNDSGRSDWPFNTSQVPLVAAEPPMTRTRDVAAGALPAWSSSPTDLQEDGSAVSPLAQFALEPYAQTLRITGDSSEFGDQFESAGIEVHPNTDYLLKVKFASTEGAMAAKVTTSDRRISLSSALIDDTHVERGRKGKKNTLLAAEGGTASVPDDVKLGFASGNRSSVRLVLSNNGPGWVKQARVSSVELFEAGPTRYQWTLYPRKLIRGIQKNLFTTSRMAALTFAALAMLVWFKRKRELSILLAVPVYYLVVHSVFSTEYRYILAIHYFLFVIAAVALFSLGITFAQIISWLRSAFVAQGFLRLRAALFARKTT